MSNIVFEWKDHEKLLKWFKDNDQKKEEHIS